MRLGWTRKAHVNPKEQAVRLDWTRKDHVNPKEQSDNAHYNHLEAVATITDLKVSVLYFKSPWKLRLFNKSCVILGLT